MVYSTDSEFFRKNFEDTEDNYIAPYKQKLHVHLEKKNRGGKSVTIISGFKGTNNDLIDLGKTLKLKCGAGGSVKDGLILIQGDCRDKAVAFLKNMGYKL